LVEQAGVRPSINVLFRSAAASHTTRVDGVLLTGKHSATPPIEVPEDIMEGIRISEYEVPNLEKGFNKAGDVYERQAFQMKEHLHNIRKFIISSAFNSSLYNNQRENKDVPVEPKNDKFSGGMLTSAAFPGQKCFYFFKSLCVFSLDSSLLISKAFPAASKDLSVKAFPSGSTPM
jgi:hypothetical protein